MNHAYNSQSMIKPLRRVLLKQPHPAFVVPDPHLWHYSGQPNLEIARREHDALAQILRRSGAEVIYHNQPLPNHADAIFVHDPALVTRAGAIILRMGKELRRGEEAAMARCFESMGMPIYATLTGPATAEGGDLLWVDEHTLAIGQGFRTNRAGFEQLTEALAELGVKTMPVELPYYLGPAACLHLMSLISIVDHKLAVVYLPLLPTPFWQFLTGQGFRFIEVPENEFHTMGTNVLALAPGHCVMLNGNPVTQARLEEAGCRIVTYEGNEISFKAEGGATCLTRPILRD
jgi:N-dimethylarginine dimethylaminohydrolase